MRVLTAGALAVCKDIEPESSGRGELKAEIFALSGVGVSVLAAEGVGEIVALLAFIDEEGC